MVKKLMSLILACIIMLSLSTTALSEAQTQPSNEINLIDVYNNPEQYPDIEITAHETTDDYINVVYNDNNLSSDTKTRLISDARDDAKSGAGYNYLTFKTTVAVTPRYSCYPYFYVKCEMLGAIPNVFVEVKAASLDGNYKGKSKEFVGSLYYNLETTNRLYWDLNGDFYNNASETISEFIVPLSGNGTTTFTATHTSNHFGYINKTGVFKV